MRNGLGSVTQRHMVFLYLQQPCMTSVPIILVWWHIKTKKLPCDHLSAFLSCSSMLKQVAWLPPHLTTLNTQTFCLGVSEQLCVPSVHFLALHFWRVLPWFAQYSALTWIDLFSRPISIHRGDWSMDKFEISARAMAFRADRGIEAHFLSMTFFPDSYWGKSGIVIPHWVEEKKNYGNMTGR